MGMLEEVAAYIDANTALTTGVDLFISQIPDNVSNCVAVIEGGGFSPVFTQGSNNLPKYERPSLQVIVRNASYATGRSLADTIYRLLTQVTNQTLSSTRYHRITANDVPTLFQRDESRRVLFSTNFEVLKELS